MCVHAHSLQSCPILWDPMDCSLPDSSVHGILQARILEWVPVPSSRGSSQPRDQIQVSRISGRFFTAESPEKPTLPCTKAQKTALSIRFIQHLSLLLAYMSHKYMNISISTSQSFLQVKGTTGRIIEIRINDLYWKFTMYQALWPPFLKDSLTNKQWGRYCFRLQYTVEETWGVTYPGPQARNNAWDPKLRLPSQDPVSPLKKREDMAAS